MNDLTNVNQIDLQAMNELLGTQVTGGTGGAIVRVPELKINSRSRDKDTKKAIPEGSYFLTNMDQKVYGETVTFRPLATHLQYFHWDEIDGKRTLVNKSIAIPSPRDEARDIKGGIACGYPSWETLQEMDYADAKVYKAMKHRVTRGLVSYDGVTADGEKVSIENQPCIMFHKNSTFGGFWNGYMKNLPKGSNIYEYETEMGADYNENGSVVWYTPTYKVDLSKKLDMTQQVFDTMSVFAQAIKKENQEIDAKYFTAIKEGSLDSKAMNALNIEDSLDNDFVDVA